MRYQYSKPPKIFRLFLGRLLRPSIREATVEEFEERYKSLAESNGRIPALIWYGYQITALLSSFIINLIYWSTAMFKNYFKIALRNIKKQKVYSIINISGLALGLTCFILIFLFIQFELSYDRHFEHADRIYKIIYKFTEKSYMGTDKEAHTHPPCVTAILNNFPEVESGTRISKYYNGKVQIDNNSFYEQKWIWADEHFFDIFTIPLVYGNHETALEQPNSVVIDEETSLKFFGNDNPVGKTLSFEYRSSVIYKITGVIENIPENSHFKAHFIGSYETCRNMGWPLDSWDAHWFHSYILLKDGIDYLELEEKIQLYIKEHIILEGEPKSWTYILQPLTDIHLKSADIVKILEPGGDIKNVYICSVMTILILLIACVNFINLSTARSVNRSKEVCVRKVIGAHRSQLLKQFLGESTILTFISLLFAFILSYLFLEPFASFVERDINLDLINKGITVLAIMITGVFVCIISGYYPAVYLSGIKSLMVLKGNKLINSRGVNLRNLLVVFQFSISLFLIFFTLVLSDQLDFVSNKNLGLDRENIIAFKVDDNIVQNSAAVKNELLMNSNIKGITFSLTLPILIDWDTVLEYEGRPDNVSYKVYFCEIDYDFLDVFDIELVSGRNFSREIITDNTGEGTYIMNETAAKQLGWADPVGKKIGISSSSMGIVIGVVSDFNSISLHFKQEPVVLRLPPGGYARHKYMSIKIYPENISESITTIKNIWNKYSDASTFNYAFLDELYDNMYKAEIKLHDLLRYMTLLTIFISCLGLFGLTSFTAVQRRKEISIRKTLGASIPDILKLLSWKFIKWIIIANIIALPVGYYATNKWLQNFAYRISIGIWIFIFSAAIALVIALLTIGFQTLKAAAANPVEALKYE